VLPSVVQISTSSGASSSQMTGSRKSPVIWRSTARWPTFDEITAASPAELRKGPRGGGRDRDQLIGHVIGAGTAYAVVGAPSDGAPVVPGGWTTRYAARRITWHVLEDAWEMQDRADSQMAQPGGPARPRRRPRQTGRDPTRRRTARQTALVNCDQWEASGRDW
jgi:hypothetical protein